MEANLALQRFLKTILTTGSELKTRNSVVKRKKNLLVTFNETPLVSIRRTAWKNALREMEWFLSGSCNINDLHPKVRHWWEPWANERGTIPNNYSEQFKNFAGIPYEDGLSDCQTTDQIEYMIQTLKNHPQSRRNVITTWNTTDMLSPETPITNCHGTVIQAFVEPDDDSVHLTMYQRSCDMVLGVPHNWIQYWALLEWISHQSGRNVGSFTWIGGDCHIYKDHYEMSDEIVNTDLSNASIPDLIYSPSENNFKANDFYLSDKYEPIIKKSVNMVV